MRVLFLTASLPYPPASGGAIRTFGIMHGLHAAGHEITLLSFHTGQTSPDKTPLASICQHIETLSPPTRSKLDRLQTLLFSKKPDIAFRFYDEAFVEKLRELLSSTQYDLIQIEAIEMACYLPIAHDIQPGAKLSFDTFNAEYALQRSMYDIDRASFRRWPLAAYSLIQTRRIAQYEQAMCRLADIVFAVSSEDADLLRIFRPDGQISLVPSGIFVNDYANFRATMHLQSPALVFTGTMNYRPNVDAMLWFAEYVLPHVQDNTPAAHLYIVGNHPHPRLDVLRDNPNIRITGWVNATQPYLNSADLYIAPLRMGSGTRLKLLEAMASGCAIVATTTAAAGLHDDVKRGMIIVDDPVQMADSITTLLNDSEQRARLGAEARELVQQYYDWSVLIPKLLKAYKGIGLG